MHGCNVPHELYLLAVLLTMFSLVSIGLAIRERGGAGSLKYVFALLALSFGVLSGGAAALIYLCLNW